jgi:hypothetical protein
MALLVLVGGVYALLAPVRESKGLEQSLIDRYDWANKYTPPADGSIPPDRLQRFLRVRQAVQSSCRDFQAVLDDVLTLEAVETDADMPAREKASKSVGGFKSMLSFAPRFLRFMDARNSSLLAEEMGLGEYFHLYLSAYAAQLVNERYSKYAAMEEAYITERTRHEYSLILTNQLMSLEATRQTPADEHLMEILRKEIAALKSGINKSPWPDGVPDKTLVSLAPYHERLSDLYCTGVAKIELAQKNRGFELEG